LKEKKRLYQSYLLRLWRETTRSRWRFSLHESGTGVRRAFNSIEALAAFLAANTEDDGRVDDGEADA
jgi:hypothetical protein